MLALPVAGSRARTGCGTVQGMSEPIQSPVFVGRREEIESLAALLRRAADGEPGFAIVAGEAGVGKTRLVTELAGQAADSGFTVLAGHCVELGAEGLPLARSSTRCARWPAPRRGPNWPMCSARPGAVWAACCPSSIRALCLPRTRGPSPPLTGCRCLSSWNWSSGC